MDLISNPYTPNAGERPDVLAGRESELEIFNTLLKRVARGRAARSMIITGLRGVGKTVLLGQFRETARRDNWAVVEYEAAKHDELGFRRDLSLRLRAALFELSPRTRWTERFERAAAALSAFHLSFDPTGQLQAGLNVERISGLADHGDLTMDLTDLFVSIGEAAQDRKRGVALLIDEVQFLSRPQLEAVIIALHKTVQRALPILLVGAGLPQVAELAGDAKSYAERLFTFPRIGNLSLEDSFQALRGPARAENVDYSDEALEYAHELTGGYPYFIQELGWATWSVAEASPITKEDIREAAEAYEARLDSSFFRVRLERATELQTAYLRAMAELGSGPQKAADVAGVLKRESTQLGPTRAELIDMGLLYTPQHGYAEFTVPHFDKYMRRAIPKVIVPSRRSRKQA